MNNNIIQKNLKKFEDYLICKNLSEKTIKSYLFISNIYLSFSNNNFDKSILMIFIKECKKKLKPRSFRLYVIVISQLFKFKKIKWINEWKENFKLPKIFDEPRLVLNKDEINKILKNFNLQRFYQFKKFIWLKILFETGIRISEFQNLKKSDIKNSCIEILGKGQKQRIIFISNELNDHIKKWKFEYFCINKKGEKISEKQIRRIIKKIGQENGYINLTPHTLRRSFCTHLIMNGCNLKALQLMMGHSSLNTTSKYIYLNQNQIYSEYLKFFN